MTSPWPVMRVFPYISNSGGLPSTEVTFAKHLHDNAGYKTALFGKWHLGVSCESRDDMCHHPNSHGFDYFYGIPMSNVRDLARVPGDTMVERHKDHFIQIILQNLAVIVAALLVGRLFRFISFRTIIVLVILLLFASWALFWFLAHSVVYLSGYLMRQKSYVEHPIRLENMTRRLVNEAKEFIDQHKKAKTDQPLLIFMSWLQVHTALHTSKEFTGVSRHGDYGDNIEEMDWSVGQIVDHFKKLQLLDNTFVYFSSDHGGHVGETSLTGAQEGGFNGIFRGGKAQGGMEGGIRVPTVAMWKDHIKPGTVIDVPTSMMDIFPTLSDIIGTENRTADSHGKEGDQRLDGHSILPLLRGQSNSSPYRFLFHYTCRDIHSVRFIEPQAVWKVHLWWPKLVNGSQECEHGACLCGVSFTELEEPLIYRIDKDPGENTPLFHTSSSSTDQQQRSRILSIIREAITKHSNSIEPYDDQFTVSKLFPRPWMQPCCGTFPQCQCTDTKNPA